MFARENVLVEGVKKKEKKRKRERRGIGIVA